MDIYIARQPIFNRQKKVVAYELLYRSSSTNQSDILDGDQATIHVITNAFVNYGFENLIGNSKAFINFTKKLIEREIPNVLDNNLVVIELLEDIKPDPTFIGFCKKLKAKGYTIALDDYELADEKLELVELADIIKVDFMLNTNEERAEIVNKYDEYNVRFLAEKVEDSQEFEDAMAMGYDYFQGYFFQKPEMIKSRDIKSLKMNHLRILKELSKKEPDIIRISDIIKSDLSLSYKLLKLVNSPAFYKRHDIVSIQLAISYLGTKEIKRWISLIMIHDYSEDKPKELVRSSIIRGKMAELLTKLSSKKINKNEAFFTGMFSLMDSIMDRSLESIIFNMPLSKDVKYALISNEASDLKHLLYLIESYEHAKWGDVDKYSKLLLINTDEVFKCYLESIKWINQVFSII